MLDRKGRSQCRRGDVMNHFVGVGGHPRFRPLALPDAHPDEVLPVVVSSFSNSCPDFIQDFAVGVDWIVVRPVIDPAHVNHACEYRT